MGECVHQWKRRTVDTDYGCTVCQCIESPAYVVKNLQTQLLTARALQLQLEQLLTELRRQWSHPGEYAKGGRAALDNLSSNLRALLDAPEPR